MNILLDSFGKWLALLSLFTARTVQSAKVRVMNNRNKPIIIQRSLRHLVPMRIHASTKDSNLDSDNNAEHAQELTKDEKKKTSRPKRTAAVTGDLLRKECS